MIWLGTYAIDGCDLSQTFSNPALNFQSFGNLEGIYNLYVIVLNLTCRLPLRYIGNYSMQRKLINGYLLIYHYRSSSFKVVTVQAFWFKRRRGGMELMRPQTD